MRHASRLIAFFHASSHDTPAVDALLYFVTPTGPGLQAARRTEGFQRTLPNTNQRRGLKESSTRYVHSRPGRLYPRHDRPGSPKKKGPERKALFKRLEKDVFHRLGDKGKSISVHSDDSMRWSHHSSRRDTESCHQSSCFMDNRVRPERTVPREHLQEERMSGPESKAARRPLEVKIKKAKVGY
ncbi:hypothetical protein Tco_1063235 [Tanacetum coccineum]